jgi:hypothetical protein
MLNNTARLLHDAAARKASSLYESAPVANDAAATAESITVEALIDGVASNYAICALNAIQLKSLQAHVLSAESDDLIDKK